MKSIKELKNIRGKRVLVRVDFNVPIRRGTTRNVTLGHNAELRGIVEDDTRIMEAVPTIKWLMGKSAKVVVMSHFGRPTPLRHPERSEGSRTNVRASARDSSAFGLRMTALHLGELLKKTVHSVEEWNFKIIGKQVKKMKVGEILMLPNLRLHPGEEKNDPVFAAELAALAQIYVNEAFSVCHRNHASVVGVPKLLPSYAGLRLEKEIEVLECVLRAPKKPLVVLIGGAKIVDKIAMIKTMLRKADTVLIGGALANHFFKAAGYGIGASLVDPQGVRLAKKLLGHKKIVLPKDVVVGTRNGKVAKVTKVAKVAKDSSATSATSGSSATICRKPYGIWDIGPQTILEFAKHIKSARTLVWNGPMGLYEVKPYSHSTLALGRLFAARSRGKAFGVIGGGETIDAMKKTGMMEYVDFVSTGGGAMLEFLGGNKLPGLAALIKSPS